MISREEQYYYQVLVNDEIDSSWISQVDAKRRLEEIVYFKTLTILRRAGWSV